MSACLCRSLSCCRSLSRALSASSLELLAPSAVPAAQPFRFATAKATAPSRKAGAVRLHAVERTGVPRGWGLRILTRSLVHSSEADVAASASSQIASLGYAVLKLGSLASLSEIEAAARPLLGLGANGSNAGDYNKWGGVTRTNLGDSSFLDAAEGAPRELPIPFHNEKGYASAFPKRIAFAMIQPAERGGTTLLADNVEVTKLLSPKLRAKMALGVRYVRLLHPEDMRGNEGFYASWEGVFQTSDYTEAVKRALEAGDLLEPLSDGVRHKHTTWAPLFVTHPEFGELYFSSILGRHQSWFNGHPYFGALPSADRPQHCTWPDGSELSEAELDELRAVHEQCTIPIHLEAGDLIVMDNLRVSHGRTAWSGHAGRRMGVLISELQQRESKRTPPKSYIEGLASVTNAAGGEKVD